jgi:hypothetical protein
MTWSDAMRRGKLGAGLPVDAGGFLGPELVS